MTQGDPDLLLVGDIGGTKTDLLILSLDQGVMAPLAKARFKSAEYADLKDMLREFLATTGLSVKRACLDVAGPVVDGRAQLTNLPWAVDGQDLRNALSWESVHILNDLAAIGHAIPVLKEEDLHVLNGGEEEKAGTKAIVAPGTGLGEAFLVWNGQEYTPFPSEGGHADFAPPTETLLELIPYLRRRVNHVSYELVCSGIGIPYLYEFFRDRNPAHESPELAAALAVAADRTPVIIEWALRNQDPCPLCRDTLEAFIMILAAEAGNLALKVFALGGIYIAGGIPPRILSLLTRDRFLAGFCAKGRFSPLLARVPVWVVTNPDVALIGCATYGLQRAKRRCPDSETGTSP